MTLDQVLNDLQIGETALNLIVQGISLVGDAIVAVKQVIKVAGGDATVTDDTIAVLRSMLLPIPPKSTDGKP